MNATGFTSTPAGDTSRVPAASPTVTWGECIAVFLCGALFLLLRVPLYTHPGLLLGWHSDAALLGLMARAIVDGDLPLLFWGCDYLAPLTSVFAALAGTTVLNDVGPLALRLGVALEFFAAFLFFHAALRRFLGWRPALLATLWLTAGPAFMFKLSYAPLSAEQYFFLGAIVFWYVGRRPFVQLHQWLVLGLLAGAGWWIHRGVMFVVVPSLVVIFWFDRRWLRRSQLAIGTSVFAVGAALGYVPAIIGRADLDQRLYTPVKMIWRVDHVQQRLLDIARYDFWSLIGADTGPGRWLFGAVMVVLLTMAIRHFEPRREALLAAGIVAVSVAFWVFSIESYRGAVRYVMVMLPILYAFAAAEIVRLWDLGRTPARIVSLALATGIAAALFIPRHIDAREVAAARREQHENWPGGFDPRPALREIAADGYRICYANVWVAHKLEWLSDPEVRFIPYRSVNRRMTESLRLAALPGKKCFVGVDGSVRAITPAEETELRLEVLWHRYGWKRATSATER